MKCLEPDHIFFYFVINVLAGVNDYFAELELGSISLCFAVCPTGVWPSGLGGHGDGSAGPVLRCVSAQIPSAEAHLLQGRLALYRNEQKSCRKTDWTPSKPTVCTQPSCMIPSSLTPSASFFVFFSVRWGSELLPASQGRQEIRADAGLVTRRPRRSTNRAGERLTYTTMVPYITHCYRLSLFCLVHTLIIVSTVDYFDLHAGGSAAPSGRCTHEVQRGSQKAWQERDSLKDRERAEWRHV